MSVLELSSVAIRTCASCSSAAEPRSRTYSAPSCVVMGILGGILVDDKEVEEAGEVENDAMAESGMFRIDVIGTFAGRVMCHICLPVEVDNEEWEKESGGARGVTIGF